MICSEKAYTTAQWHSGFKCVGALSDASDILFRIKRAAPDVILMDIDIPGKMNGLEATFVLNKLSPKCISLCRPYLKTKQKYFKL
ncbi:MAG: response regulator [Saprospiraceae bacterium]|nr:response regulator [Saprospiraceae bacterium]